MTDQNSNGATDQRLEDDIIKLRKWAAAHPGALPARNEGLTVGEPPTFRVDPLPVISEQLVENAPAQMPQIVRSMHHTAAEALEQAAHHLEQEMQSHLALMREAAEQLRIQGDGQAATIEALSTLIRDTHAGFKEQADKLARFRAGQTE